MKKDVLKAGVLGMLVASVPCMGGVDAAEMPVYSLDEVVVTATRTMKEIQEVPSSISVITAKDMEKKNIHTVRDAIGQIPGSILTDKATVAKSVCAASIRRIFLSLSTASK
ncbi:MAG: hypothetical protein E7C72_07125 [Dialister sp.]|nr:hypothetical protein [Dialister sp.]